MLDLISLARRLKRPGLLVRAARFQLDHYRRDAMLCRLLRVDETPRSGPAVIELLELEAMLDAQREANAADYDLVRHINTLTAIMGEAQILMATAPRTTT